MIKISEQAIDETEILQSVKSENAGACVLFAGTTRRFTDQKETQSLSYQAYEQMAVSQLTQLRQVAMEKWPLCDCTIVHRIGDVFHWPNQRGCGDQQPTPS